LLDITERQAGGFLFERAEAETGGAGLRDDKAAVFEKQLSCFREERGGAIGSEFFDLEQAIFTTVADRRLAVESRASGSGSAEREIDVVFAIGTSAADAQRRAIRAREGE
jgi:hypothetical protein